MQRYFVTEKEGEDFLLHLDDCHHVQKVMRMSLGETVEIVYQDTLYLASLVALEPRVRAKLLEKQEEDSSLSLSVTLVQSAVKEQKMDTILQKATELGVDKIYPFQAERSVVKLSDKWEKKKVRWEKIVKEASEQSKRVKIPEIGDILSINHFLDTSKYTYCLLCTVREKQKVIKKVLSKCKKGDTMIIIVGPEGGFTEFEEEQFEKLGFLPVSLGKSVLRTETASLFLLSAVRYIDME